MLDTHPCRKMRMGTQGQPIPRWLAFVVSGGSMTAEQVNEVAGNILDQALAQAAALYDEDRPDVAYAIRKAIG